MIKSRILSVLTAVLAAGFLLLSGCSQPQAPAAPTQPAAQPVTLTILGTSDVHGNLLGYSYEDNEPTDDDGLARVCTYVSQVREENPNTLLLDNGDCTQGTILTDDLYTPFPEKEHPVFAAMNFMGYDAMTLGNHEFNWGVPNMQALLSQAEFPVLCANIRDKDGSCVTGSGWVILEKAGLKIAVIGVTTPYIPLWDGGKEGIDTLTYHAGAAAVREALAQLPTPVDLTVVCSHMGMEGSFDMDADSGSAGKILEENPEIDVLMLGHDHVTIARKDGSTLIGAPEKFGSQVVRFDLTFNEEKELVSTAVEVVDMAAYAPSAQLAELPAVAQAHQQTLCLITGIAADGTPYPPLGSTTARFQPDDEIPGIPAGRIMDTAVPDLINRIQLENSQADVSAASLFKSTSDLPAGDLYYSNIFDIYKFDNTIYRVSVTGAELRAYMEWSAGHYNQWTPGDIHISFDPEHPDYLYDMFAGVDYEIDLSQPKGQRIRNVMFRGAPLEDDQLLTLAVNNYRYHSALVPFGFVSHTPQWESSCSVRDMIVAYFAENSPVSPEVDNNWRIVGVDLELDNPLRTQLLEKLRTGELETPCHKSINLRDFS